MSTPPKKTGKIHHPKPGKRTHGPHFIAFGAVDKGTRPSGKVIEEGSRNETPGTLVYLAHSKHSRKQMFWGLRFQVEASPGKTYTVQIVDENGQELASSTGIDLSPDPSKSRDPVKITYPHDSDNPIPLEFVAYGTADAAGGDVSGTMTNCDTPPTDIEEEEPPPDWTLYCYIVNPSPPSCDLTVSQDEADPPVDPATASGLTFD